jgi:hypothetical protein
MLPWELLKSSALDSLFAYEQGCWSPRLWKVRGVLATEAEGVAIVPGEAFRIKPAGGEPLVSDQV